MLAFVLAVLQCLLDRHASSVNSVYLGLRWVE